jgi:hypothetical protein
LKTARKQGARTLSLAKQGVWSVFTANRTAEIIYIPLKVMLVASALALEFV